MSAENKVRIFDASLAWVKTSLKNFTLLNTRW